MWISDLAFVQVQVLDFWKRGKGVCRVRVAHTRGFLWRGRGSERERADKLWSWERERKRKRRIGGVVEAGSGFGWDAGSRVVSSWIIYNFSF